MLFLIALSGALGSGAPVPNARIRSDISGREAFTLKGNTRPAIEAGLAHDKGKVSSSLALPHIVMHFAMTAAQRSDLEQLLKAQQDRRSPHYHQFLTPEQYAERFGLASGDIEKLSHWLESNGFSELQVARSRNWVSFSGNAEKVEAAFHVPLHRYSLNGETHFANSADPQLPKELEGVVESVRGLHNFAARPFVRQVSPRFKASNGYDYVSPDDWATIYNVKPLFAAGLDGTGVTIAVVGQSDVAMSDIQAFRAAAGLPANDPEIMVPPGSHDPGIQTTSGDELESAIDLEWAGAIAKNAHILFITASASSGNGVADAMAYAIDNNVAPIVSISYGQCEADLSTADFQAQNGLLQQANAEGMTIVAASGDSGPAACDAFSNPDHGNGYATHGFAVDFPASSAYVTGVGGTSFTSYGQSWSASNNSSGGSALSYFPEQVWNDFGTPISGGSGGGASKLVSKPIWQVGQGVPADDARDVPDVAFAASIYSGGLVACFEGSCSKGFLESAGYPFIVGGTSVAAPPFAGVLALVIQEHGAGGRLGNINPNLYSLAQIPNNNVFHDILSGNNKAFCQSGAPDCIDGFSMGFLAGPGYDQATGLGSVNAYNLTEQWYGDVQVSLDPSTITIQPGTSATANISLAPQNNFDGPVTFTCAVASALVDVTCSIPNPTLNTSGTTTVIISAASTARAPFWKGMRIYPPRGRGWHLAYLMVMLLLLATSFLVFSHERGVTYQPSRYVVNSVLLVAMVVGVVSCGGADSAPVSSGSKGAGSTTPAVLTLTCNLPANATTNVAYSGSCTAGGGTGGVTFSLSNGSLPAGLNLNTATGAITGTPTTPGTSSFTMKVTDSGSPAQTAVQAETNFTVVAQIMPLILTCGLPADANNATAYSGGCSASGGTSPFSFSITGGTLSSGLVLNSATGAITGQPTTIGTTSFTVQVTDTGSPAQTAMQTISNFSVTAGPLSLSCPLSSNPSVRKAYSGGCSATGGTPPFKYSIVSGALPQGLILDPSTGAITGIPLAATPPGANPYMTVSVRDSGSPAQTATQVNYFPVANISPLGVTCPAASAELGVVVTAYCGAYYGNSPYTGSVVEGMLPPGLSMSTSGGLEGTPTLMGTYAFTVQFADSSSPPLFVQAKTSITVGPRPTETGLVTITATSGGIVTTSTITVTVPQANAPN